MQASCVELDGARAALEVGRRNRAKCRSTSAEAAQAAAEAAHERTQTINETASRVASAGSIGDLSSPAAVERNLDRALVDLAAFTQVMDELRSMGAPAWLLAQLNEADRPAARSTSGAATWPPDPPWLDSP